MENNLSNRVVLTGFVNENELTMLYQNADIFISPSIFEGFGFTPLEAMAAGTAVCVSRSTSHPEVCGDAALYFDPFDVDEIAEQLRKIIHDDTTKQNLIGRGFENVKRFDWQQSCKQTFDLYEKSLESI